MKNFYLTKKKDRYTSLIGVQQVITICHELRLKFRGSVDNCSTRQIKS